MSISSPCWPQRVAPSSQPQTLQCACSAQVLLRAEHLSQVQVVDII